MQITEVFQHVLKISVSLSRLKCMRESVKFTAIIFSQYILGIAVPVLTALRIQEIQTLPLHNLTMHFTHMLIDKSRWRQADRMSICLQMAAVYSWLDGRRAACCIWHQDCLQSRLGPGLGNGTGPWGSPGSGYWMKHVNSHRSHKSSKHCSLPRIHCNWGIPNIYSDKRITQLTKPAAVTALWPSSYDCVTVYMAPMALPRQQIYPNLSKMPLEIKYWKNLLGFRFFLKHPNIWFFFGAWDYSVKQLNMIWQQKCVSSTTEVSV